MVTKQTRTSRWERSPLELRALIQRVKQQHPLLAVLSAAGVRTRKHGNSYMVANCPFPNHQDDSPSFKVKLSVPDRFLCYGCQAAGDVLDFVHYFYGKQTLDEQIRFLTGKGIRELGESRSVEELQQAAGERDRRRRELEEARRRERGGQSVAPDGVAGRAYEALLSRLDLCAEHRDQIEKRGIRADEALELGYRTLPVDREVRINLCEELLSDGYNLRGVPGFFILPARAGCEGGRWCVGGTSHGWREIRDKKTESVWEVPGMLVPTCDEAGRVVRLKLRNDPHSADAPEWVKEAWPARYVALSSKDRCGGAGAGLRLHYVGPADGGKFPRAMWVTEGEVKADIASMMLGARVVGLPGVGQCLDLAVEAARRGGQSKLYVAMDSETKGHVQLAVARLCRMAREAGVEPLVVVWDGGVGKGIDDLLVANGEWHALAYAEWWRGLSSRERDYVGRRLEGACVG
jgi:hypothetical protein